MVTTPSRLSAIRLGMASVCLAVALVSGANARIRAIPYTDKELAQRGAKIYSTLLDISRNDADAPPAAFARVAARTWAYQALVHILEENPVEKLPPPPSSEGWRQLFSLLLQSNLPDASLAALKRAGPVLSEEERLFLEIAFLNKADQSAEGPAVHLLQLLKENPIMVEKLGQRWRTGSPAPFRGDHRVWMRLLLKDDQQKEISSILDASLRSLYERSVLSADTWTLLTPEAAPGQEILIRGAARFKPNWTGATVTQYNKSQAIESRQAYEYLNPSEGLFYGSAVFGIPESIQPGLAKISVPQAGEFEVRIVSSPAPARIESVNPFMAVPGEWVNIQSVGLQANRDREIYISEKEKSKTQEWLVSAIFSQGGQEWTVERNVQVWRGRIQDQLVFRVPWGLARGAAQVKLKLQDSISEPYTFLVGEWPAAENFARAERENLVGMPGTLLTLKFRRPGDAQTAMLIRPSGKMEVWRPEVPAEQGQAMNSESRWRVSTEWEVGVHDVIWATRIGGLWSIADLVGETITVSPFAPAPKLQQASFLRNSEGTMTTLGRNGYETFKYTKGDIYINGEGIEAGETYEITVRFAFGNEYSTRRIATHDFVMFVNVSPTGPSPEAVEVRRVIGDIPGMPATQRVAEQGGVMVDLFTAQTESGQSAVEWLMQVRSKLRLTNPRDPPSMKQMLTTLQLDTFPISPWGGPWMYVRTPAHSSLTFLAHDLRGVLKAQFYSGGIGAGLVEYDLLTRVKDDDAETYGVVQDNLYWTAPWGTNGLGNLVTDALRAATNADAAIHNTLGLRGNLPAGVVTSDLIEHILPFDNDLIVLHLKGSDLQGLLQDAFESGKYTYPSGMSLEVDTAPKGVTVTIKMGIGKIFSKDAIYKVAMPSYLADKQAGYPKTQSAIQRDEFPDDVRQAVQKYIRKHSPVPADRTARVIERLSK